MNNVIRASLISAACLCALGSANAATATGTMGVKITITATCAISSTAAADVNFGSVASTATLVPSTGGALSVNCTTGVPYTIGINDGANFLTTRRMVNGTNFIPYGLFRDAAFANAWGATVALSVAGTGTGAVQTVPVYGRVPSAAAAIGNYTDTVTATITY